jgi:hypothetical protein
MCLSRFVQLGARVYFLVVVCAVVLPVADAFGQEPYRPGSQGMADDTAGEPAAAAPNRSGSLDAFVKSVQHGFVRESINEQNCFTWDHLTFLRKDLDSGRIARLIQRDPDFELICKAVKRIGPDERQGVYDNALGIFRQTWAEQGSIGPPGQTDAGQQADILVGRLVVELVQRRVGQSAQQGSAVTGPMKVGDRFQPVADGTPVQVETHTVATVDAGETVTAIAINGPWIGVAVRREGREIRGWIHRQYLTAPEAAKGSGVDARPSK